MSVENEFDPLDELLAKAQWPPPSIESTQRLRGRWAGLRRNSARTIWPMGVAAAAAIVCGARIFLAFESSQPSPVVVARQGSAATVAPRSVPAESGRAATPLELAMLQIAAKQGRSGRQGTGSKPNGVPLVPLVSGWTIGSAVVSANDTDGVMGARDNQARGLVQRAIGTNDLVVRSRVVKAVVALGPGAAPFVFDLMANQSTKAAAIDAVCEQSAGWTEELFGALKEPRVAVRVAAANALARIDGPVITGRLIRMAGEGVSRREAVAALVQIQSSQARQFVAAASESPELSAMIRSAMAQNQGSQL